MFDQGCHTTRNFNQVTDGTTHVACHLGCDFAYLQVMKLLLGIAFLLYYPINQVPAWTALPDMIQRYIIVHPPLPAVTLTFFVASVGTACIFHDLGVIASLLEALVGHCLFFCALCPGRG